MPLAFARAIPAFVRSLIFCASSFAKDESNASRMFRIGGKLALANPEFSEPPWNHGGAMTQRFSKTAAYLSPRHGSSLPQDFLLVSEHW